MYDKVNSSLISYALHTVF